MSAKMRSFPCLLLWLTIWAIGWITAVPLSPGEPRIDKRNGIFDGDDYSVAGPSNSTSLGLSYGIIPDSRFVESRYETNLSAVPAPEGFHVLIRYLPGAPMPVRATWGHILDAIGDTALLGSWGKPIPRNLIWKAIKIVPSVNPPRFRFEDVMFSLVDCFGSLIVKEDYRPMAFKTLIGKDTLGLGKIFNPDLNGQSNYSSRGVEGDGWTSSEAPGLALPLSPQTTTATNSSLLTASAPRNTKFTIEFESPKDAQPFAASSIYWAAMTLIMLGAKIGRLGGPSGAQAFYSSKEDYTLTVYPTSEAATEKLTWTYVIQGLRLLPPDMASRRRFATGHGKIRVDGRIVGNLRVAKGRPDSQYLDTMRSMGNVTVTSDNVSIS